MKAEVGQVENAAPAPASNTQKIIALGIVGAAVGLFAATVMRKKK